MLMTLPPGAKISQFKAEHPTTNYDMFVNAKLREAGRVLCVPFGKMAGDHSRYNYSSGRLDDAPYWADRDIERQGLEAKAFNPMLYLWCEFAKFAIPGLIRYEREWWKLKHSWHYDARPTSDPVKDATGDELNLTNGSDTLAAIAARDGTTVEALLDQRQREKKMFEERGLPLPPWMAGQPAPGRPGDGMPQNPADAKASQEMKVAA
jgi:capsid protein